MTNDPNKLTAMSALNNKAQVTNDPKRMPSEWRLKWCMECRQWVSVWVEQRNCPKCKAEDSLRQP